VQETYAKALKGFKSFQGNPAASVRGARHVVHSGKTPAAIKRGQLPNGAPQHAAPEELSFYYECSADH
jgi:hypothetical protein